MKSVYPLAGGIRQNEGDRYGYHYRRCCVVVALPFMIHFLPIQSPRCLLEFRVSVFRLYYSNEFKYDARWMAASRLLRGKGKFAVRLVHVVTSPAGLSLTTIIVIRACSLSARGSSSRGDIY